ncbi:LysR family transcriptional regulator [Streptomyces europaeiscabiei]|uniref:LysR family transcriptional regulator n=1 Tax=Streptomyces europaeiscabiei TaxID=146819 RepID=UPI0029B777B9|nr:LysR family transcriptional regulator [Streptomyces europaeiscabiei]MDX3585036.1 LysR family transcriptional regulator [Streptomyces europaeiscabiei]MDX3612087.1 LysR family transcriptional regulator [Streptomyces europaeiscabiei]MDX3635116.1 LysR family transcriptional regulator [Streptomyces europaeiscabiei]MDX3650100.1 LysR family transcriptional regulator [Streptomyces europaeiscabiei]WUD37679.1 LysR family transcriptional regulator [Streptomyces europaeiscabiei]
MSLSGLDLNLVLSLRALLEERNVTRAGQRIGLSQPAMSAALARLRRHFDDELLSRVGGQYELTALGIALLDRTATACDLLDRVFSSRAEFLPGSEEHEFTLLSSDYAVAVFGAELARTVHAEAPGVRLRFQRTPPDVTEDTAPLLSTADGLLMPHGVISGFPAVGLFTDRWAFLVAETNDEVGDRLTMDDLARLPWVIYQRTYDAPAARQLSMLGIDPHVEVFVDSFQALPFLVAGTHRIALVQQRLAEQLSGVAAVRIMEPPYEAVPLQNALWWHPVHTHDAAHIWLRETAARVGAELASSAPGRIAAAARTRHTSG